MSEKFPYGYDVNAYIDKAFEQMKKIFLFQFVAMMLAACGGQKSPQDGGHGIGVEHRKQYRFEYQLVKDDDGRFGSIIVRGHKADDNSRVFQCKHELADPQNDDSGSDTDWINDTEDINFDGIPDLQIFLMCYTRGQVARKFAAYVWTSRGQFEEVEQWTDLCNPEIHPENQTITEHYRSDINERTYNTYKWNGDTLKLINTRKGKFFGE